MIAVECYDSGDARGTVFDNLPGDPCPHGHAWREGGDKLAIDCPNVCRFFNRP